MKQRHHELLLRILGVVGGTPSIVAGYACGGETLADSRSDPSAADASGESASDADLTFVPVDGGRQPLDPPHRCANLFVDAGREWVEAGPSCPVDASTPEWTNRDGLRVCLAPPEHQACASTYDDDCILEGYRCGLFQRGTVVGCGPTVRDDGACCYVVFGGCAVGRPFLVSNAARMADAVARDDWSDPVAPNVTALDATTRAALAEAWQREALAEHASVASFARLLLHLLAVGAPSDLLLATQRAIAEEQDHARVCFGLASAYAGRSVGPGKLSIAGALDGASDLATIAAASASEGCIAETVSALQILAAADAATDVEVRARLRKIAAEEANHALLAWSFVAWALKTGDAEVRARVSATFARASMHVGFGARTELPGDVDAMRAHGYLPVAERRRLASDALGNVVVPAAAQLLKGLAPSRQTAAPLGGATKRTRSK